ncbi:hypothetical protein ACFWFZ_12425 [Streptomyces sp. NPDC060232]|uniref:hypothetical protein n=1 Tax=Streptomyces sp. NPDC060232 TaxID=3347079 RepID=UPI003659879B
MEPVVRCLRALRAVMFAALCVLLAATGHMLMSGTAVPWWALPLGFGAAAATAWSLAGRERGILCVTGAAVAVQAVLHSAFSLAQSLAGPAPESAAAEAAVHAHHAVHGAADAASAPTAMHMTDGGHGSAVLPPAFMSPAGMLIVHLLAAVLCGLWLAHGERALFRVLRAVAARLWVPLCLLLRPAAVAHRPRLRVRRRRGPRAPRRLFLVHAITSRGPPTATAVL